MGHHRNCYGYLVMHGGSKEMKKCYAVDGIRMAEYMERYEAKNLTKIHHKDRAKLTQLTSKTLFCRYCYQPIHEQRYEDELTSPIIALTDLLSAVFLPVGLIPLLLILPILMIYEEIVRWTRDDNEEKTER